MADTVIAYLESIEKWVEMLLPVGPAAEGKIGAAIVLFYFALFLLIGLLRGKIWPRRGEDGNFHLSDLFAQAVKTVHVPLVFVALGFVWFLLIATCIGNPEEQIGFDCHLEDVSCESCAGITAYEGPSYASTPDIRWTASLANAYGYGVIRFQFVVGIGVIAALVFGIGIVGGKTIQFLLWIMWRVLGRHIWNGMQKIPVRF